MSKNLKKKRGKKFIFYKFDTIKHIRNFEKYGVWYGRTHYIIFQKKGLFGTIWYCLVLFGTVWYCLVLFGTVWYEIYENSRESL
jgi:hypothetical protein